MRNTSSLPQAAIVTASTVIATTSAATECLFFGADRKHIRLGNGMYTMSELVEFRRAELAIYAGGQISWTNDTCDRVTHPPKEHTNDSRRTDWEKQKESGFGNHELLTQKRDASL